MRGNIPLENVFDDTPLAHFEAMMEAVAEYNKAKGF